jgi:hypothetical protein
MDHVMNDDSERNRLPFYASPYVAIAALVVVVAIVLFVRALMAH